jgi:hypothetical protein
MTIASRARETSNAMYMLERTRQEDLARVSNPNTTLPGSDETYQKIADAFAHYKQAFEMRREAEAAEVKCPPPKPE